MSNSYKSFSTTLEKMKKRKDRQEHVDWKAAQELAERKEWEKYKKLREYLRDKGELED